MSESFQELTSKNRGPATCVFCRRPQKHCTYKNRQWWSCYDSIYEVIQPICPRSIERRRLKVELGLPTSVFAPPSRPLTDAEWKTIYDRAWAARLRWPTDLQAELDDRFEEDHAAMEKFEDERREDLE